MNVSDHFPRFTEDFRRLLKKIWLYVDKHFLACLTFNKGKHVSQREDIDIFTFHAQWR